MQALSVDPPPPVDHLQEVGAALRVVLGEDVGKRLSINDLPLIQLNRTVGP